MIKSIIAAIVIVQAIAFVNVASAQSTYDMGTVIDTGVGTSAIRSGGWIFR